MKQKGKIRLGKMVLDAEFDIEMVNAELPPLHANCRCDADSLNVVEGSLVEPITDPTRLLAESEAKL